MNKTNSKKFYKCMNFIKFSGVKNYEIFLLLVYLFSLVYSLRFKKL